MKLRRREKKFEGASITSNRIKFFSQTGMMVKDQSRMAMLDRSPLMAGSDELLKKTMDDIANTRKKLEVLANKKHDRRELT
jgi:hypothetical protein